MPEHSLKNNLPWTESHEVFCYKHHITPTAKSLLQWLMRQGEIGTELEPDLKEFNKWVAKVRGKGYGQSWLKKAFQSLVDNRIVQVIKKFNWNAFRLVIRPTEWLEPPKKTSKQKLQNSNSSCKQEHPNDSNAVEESLQQQHSTNKQLLEDNGIYYDDNVTEVLQRPTNEIKLALIMFALRGGFEKIPNPEGWICDCLRRKYWKHPRNHNHLLQLYGNSTEWDILFPDG